MSVKVACHAVRLIGKEGCVRRLVLSCCHEHGVDAGVLRVVYREEVAVVGRALPPALMPRLICTDVVADVRQANRNERAVSTGLFPADLSLSVPRARL